MITAELFYYTLQKFIDDVGRLIIEASIPNVADRCKLWAVLDVYQNLIPKEEKEEE